MRIDTLFRFDNTFEVWESVSQQDPITGQTTVEYVYTLTDKGLIIPMVGDSIILASRTAYPIRSKVRAVRDRNGIAIFTVNGTEYDMFITQAAPQYDGFGSIVGYRHTLRRTLPRIVDTDSVFAAINDA